MKPRKPYIRYKSRTYEKSWEMHTADTHRHKHKHKHKQTHTDKNWPLKRERGLKLNDHNISHSELCTYIRRYIGEFTFLPSLKPSFFSSFNENHFNLQINIERAYQICTYLRKTFITLVFWVNYKLTSR